jgi:hypothetical protein
MRRFAVVDKVLRREVDSDWGKVSVRSVRLSTSLVIHLMGFFGCRTAFLYRTVEKLILIGHKER